MRSVSCRPARRCGHESELSRHARHRPRRLLLLAGLGRPPVMRLGMLSIAAGALVLVGLYMQQPNDLLVVLCSDKDTQPIVNAGTLYAQAAGMASPDKKSFALRLDPPLWAQIERLAAQELRSANAQIEYLLRDALARRGIKPASSPPPKRGRPANRMPPARRLKVPGDRGRWGV